MTYIYFQDIVCQRCGYRFAGYAARTSLDHAAVGCPSCGQNIYIPLQPGMQYNEYPDVQPSQQQQQHSTYGDLYEQEEQEPRFSPKHLFKVMVKPKQAFQELWPITNFKIGVMLIVVFSVLNTIISYWAYQQAGMESYPVGVGQEIDMGMVVVILGLPTAIGGALLGSWVAAKISGNMKGRGDLNRTVGFWGYAMIVGFLFGIVASLVIASNVAPMPDLPDTIEDYETYDWGPYFTYMLYTVPIAIVDFIWAVVVGGAGVSVANDTSWLKGIGIYLVSVIIAGLVLAMLMLGVVFLL